MLRELPNDWKDNAGGEWADGEDMEYDGEEEDVPLTPEEYVNMERVERIFTRRLAADIFKKPQDFTALLEERFLESNLETILAEARRDNWNDVEEAQELMFQAMCLSAETDAEEISALARRALELDPDNADAGLLLAGDETDDLEIIIPRLRDVVVRAEKGIAAELLEDFAGRLWAYAPARPYLRSRLALLGALQEDGKWQEASAEGEVFQRLAGTDDLGLEEELVALHLAAGNTRAARDLLKNAQGINGCVRDWATLLEQILSNNKAAAKKGLKKVLARNPHVPDYLFGDTELPEDLPQVSATGTREEAMHCAIIMAVAWDVHPEACAWLISLL